MKRNLISILIVLALVMTMIPVFEIESEADFGSINQNNTIAAGGVYSAAITKDGKLYTWGTNRLTNEKLMKKEAITRVESIDSAKSVALSGSTVSVITSNGDLYNWGDNAWGQLGEGKYDNYYYLKFGILTNQQ